MINRWILVTGWIWESCLSMLWFVFPSSCLRLLSSWNPAEQWRLLIRFEGEGLFLAIYHFLRLGFHRSCKKENAEHCQKSRLTWKKWGLCGSWLLDGVRKREKKDGENYWHHSQNSFWCVDQIEMKLWVTENVNNTNCITVWMCDIGALLRDDV